MWPGANYTKAKKHFVLFIFEFLIFLSVFFFFYHLQKLSLGFTGENVHYLPFVQK